MAVRKSLKVLSIQPASHVSTCMNKMSATPSAGANSLSVRRALSHGPQAGPTSKLQPMSLATPNVRDQGMLITIPAHPNTVANEKIRAGKDVRKRGSWKPHNATSHERRLKRQGYLRHLSTFPCHLRMVNATADSVDRNDNF